MIRILCLSICFLLPGLLRLRAQSGKTPDYLSVLKSREDFDKLKGAPLSGGFQGIECIKLIYDLEDCRLYYLNSKRYTWHYQFTSQVLNDAIDLNAFNEQNYSQSPQRHYILATFNYNTNTHNYFLQFSAADNIPDALIDTLVAKVRGSWFKQEHFKILLNTSTLLRRKKALSEKHEVITSDDVFRQQQYQPICKGKSRGILRFVNADSMPVTLNYSECILLMTGNSNDLPLCRGLVTNELQTPLSHICLLTNNRRTPSAASRAGFANAQWQSYEGKMVELIVGEESFQLRLASDTSRLGSRSHKLKTLKADTLTAVIADLGALSYKQRRTYGSKACNLAEARRLQANIPGLQTPAAAFAIPFYYYHDHLKRHGIDRMIRRLMQDSVVLASDSLLDKALAAIRKAIRQADMDTVFLQKVERLCENRYGRHKVRFRSSSNCEDVAGFNGAGLYDSESGRLGDREHSPERAIKKVWASLWSLRAFHERSYFQFDQPSACMAILVHEAFDNELVNGVAITRNLYRPGYVAGFVINLQKGEEPVVSPRRGQVCEQLISYMNLKTEFYDDKRSVDWLSFSSLQQGQSLLTEDELLELTRQLEALKHHFYYLYATSKEYPDFALDVEFKLLPSADGKRRFLIKQVRPYGN